MDEKISFDELKEKSVGMKLDNKIAKHLTGIDFECNPKDLLSRMEEDRVKLIEKYGIPDGRKYLGNNIEKLDTFKLELDKYVKDKGIEIVYVKDFLLEEMELSAGRDREGRLVMPDTDFDNLDKTKKNNYLITMSHELVHCVQDEDISIERGEYEAYLLADVLEPHFISKKYKDHPEGFVNLMILMDFFGKVAWSSLYDHEKSGSKVEEIGWIKK